MGLKTELAKIIKSRDGAIISFSEFESICKSMNRRVSNGERRMRECEGVEKVVNSKGHIIGYRWVERPLRQKTFQFIRGES